MSSDPRFISDGIDSRDSESTLVSRPSRRAKSDCLEESKSGHNPKMKKEGRINVRYRVEMNILRAPSRLKAVWVTVITQTRMNGSKLINWIFNGVQQFGLNEHFPMVPNSSLGMNLGSICTIQVLSIVRTGMYGVRSMSCVVERSTPKTTCVQIGAFGEYPCNSQNYWQ